MKLSTKLSVMIAVLLAGILWLGAFSLYQMDSVNDKSTDIANNWLPATVAIQNISTLASRYRIYEVGRVYAETDTQYQEYDNRLGETQASMAIEIKKYEKLIAGPEEQAIYDRFVSDWQKYLGVAVEVRELTVAKKTTQAVELLRGRSRDLFDAACASLLKDVEYNVRMGKETSEAGDKLYAHSFTSITLLMSIMAVLAVGLGFFIVRGTLRELGKDPRQLMVLARRVTEGDYAVDDGSPRLGVYGSLLAMVDSLKLNIARAQEESERSRDESQRAQTAMREAERAEERAEGKTKALLQASERLEEVARVVSASSEALAGQIGRTEQGAADQAGRVAETATAMEEMNTTVLEVARNAGLASEMSSSTRERAETGAGVVREAVSSILAVREQSTRLREDMAMLDENARAVNRIMGVISDIADQTNLLALNAAIEAARAGDAGRGFAVVADEVRKLAEKTMTSTVDVGNAIRAIQESVTLSVSQVDASAQIIEKATAFANQSGVALGEIVTMVDNTADQVRGIATAAEEQSASSEEINRSIVEVNVIAGENAAIMREAARGVEELARQAQILSTLIAEMKRG